MSEADTRINLLPLSEERAARELGSVSVAHQRHELPRAGRELKQRQSPLDIFMAQQVWDTPGTLHTPDMIPQMSEKLRIAVMEIVEKAGAFKKVHSE